jgi:hypothetical protein
MFTGNVATRGGGGGLYFAGAHVPIVSSTEFQNNGALYGPDIASEPKTIKAMVPLSTRNTEILVVSVQLVDYYNATVNDLTTTMPIKCSISETDFGDSVILGRTETVINNAVGIFDDLILAAAPSWVTIRVELDVSGNNIKALHRINVLPCKDAQYLSREGSPACTNCSIGKFNKKYSDLLECDLCPAGKSSISGVNNCFACSETMYDAGRRICNKCPEGTYQDETGATSCKTTYPPKTPVVKRLTPTTVNITFGTTSDIALAYDVQWSRDPVFEDVNPKHHVVVSKSTKASRSIVIAVDDPIEIIDIYFRVSIKDANVWSPPSKTWTVATDCGAFQYLDDRSPMYAQAEGLEPPIPSHKESDPSSWRCEPCPAGASCRHINATWDEVKALWGWWRINDYGRSKFARCIFAPGCLGAANPKLSGKFLNSTDEDPALIEGKEECALNLGHDQNCSRGERCRLCNTCLPGFEKIRHGLCNECPATPSTRGLLVAGILAVAGAASVLVWIQIHNQGRGGLSDALKKVLINYLQIASLAGKLNSFISNE